MPLIPKPDDDLLDCTAHPCLYPLPLPPPPRLFIMLGGHFNKKQKNIFEQLESEAMLFAKFHAGTRKSLSNFWTALFKVTVKEGVLSLVI